MFLIMAKIPTDIIPRKKWKIACKNIKRITFQLILYILILTYNTVTALSQ